MIQEVRDVFTFIMDRQEEAHLSSAQMLAKHPPISHDGTEIGGSIKCLNREAKALIDQMKQALIDERHFSVREAYASEGYADTAVLAPEALINEIMKRWIDQVVPTCQWDDLISHNWGQEFYREIHRIGPQPSSQEEQEIRDIYYKCLLLGFKGDEDQSFDDASNQIDVSAIRMNMQTSIEGRGIPEIPHLKKVDWVDTKKPKLPMWVPVVWGLLIPLLIAGVVGMLYLYLG